MTAHEPSRSGAVSENALPGRHEVLDLVLARFDTSRPTPTDRYLTLMCKSFKLAVPDAWELLKAVVDDPDNGLVMFNKDTVRQGPDYISLARWYRVVAPNRKCPEGRVVVELDEPDSLHVANVAALLRMVEDIIQEGSDERPDWLLPGAPLTVVFPLEMGRPPLATTVRTVAPKSFTVHKIGGRFRYDTMTSGPSDYATTAMRSDDARLVANDAVLRRALEAVWTWDRPLGRDDAAKVDAAIEALTAWRRTLAENEVTS